jgi:hypothetical protein
MHTDPDLTGVPDEVRPLVARGLVRDPAARPTPADLLAEVGTPDTAEWLPAPVRAMVTEQETELGSPKPRVPTRAYTKAGPPLPFGKDKSPAAKPPVSSRTPAKPPTAEWPSATKPPEGRTPAGESPESGKAGKGQAGNGQPGNGQPGNGQSGNGQPGGRTPVDTPAGEPRAPAPAAAPPAAAPANPPARSAREPAASGQQTGGRAVFRVSRVSAFVLGVLTTLAMLTCLAFSQRADLRGEGGMALILLGGAVFFLLPAVRQWWVALRPRRWLAVSPEGLTVGRGKQERQVRWGELARVRIVDDKRRPWVVVWSHGKATGLGAEYAGGHRVFPVGHERRTSARRREARELRAALSWYGRAVFDPSK